MKFNENQKRIISAYIHSSNDLLNQDEKELMGELQIQSLTFGMNGFLRNNVEPADLNPITNILDTCFLHTNNNPIYLYRSCNNIRLLNSINNDVILDNGYSSTTTDISILEKFIRTEEQNVYVPAILKILIPKNNSFLDTDNVDGVDNNTGESEILLPRRSSFRIENHRIIDDRNELISWAGKLLVDFYNLNTLHLYNVVLID